MPDPLPTGRVGAPPSSAAWSFLLSCARRYAAADGAADAAPKIPEDLDWTAVLELARAHGVTPFLRRFLSDSPRTHAPPDVADRLRASSRVHTQRNLRLTGALIDLARELRAEDGIDVIAFKGPVLASQLYGDVSMRDFDDLDILVRSSDVHRASRVLERKGYRPWLDLTHDEEARLASTQYARHYGNAAGRIGIDLHWGFAQPYLSFAIDEATIWQSTEHVSLGGATVTTLSKQLLLLVLCVHGSKHEPFPWCKLKWVVDVAALSHRLPSEHWPLLLQQADALRLLRPLAFGMLVAQRLLGAPIAAALAGDRRNIRALSPLVDAVVERMPAPIGRTPGLADQWAFDLRLLDRWGQRARYALRRVFIPAPKDWARWKIPDRLRFAYYLVRPIRLGGSVLPLGKAARSRR